jgi:[ribosomal protein S18]-alanine N-acetyltransferase
MPESSQPSTRIAGISDLPAVMQLEQRASTAAHWTRAQYEAIFSTPRLLLVLEEEGAVRGFLVASCTGSDWEIENVVVDESSRRRGFGRHLLADFLTAARSQCAKAVFLEVRQSNTPARALYEKHGFLQTGRRTAYFRNPSEDAILYRLLLP